MDTEAYLAAIKAKLVNSAVVRQIDIVQEYFTREQGFFRARLTLQNDDFLEIAEFFHVVQGEAHTVESVYTVTCGQIHRAERCFLDGVVILDCLL